MLDLALLAGGAVHDFNGFLTVILGNASVLRRELPEGSALHAHVDRIHRSAQYAADTVEQMLGFAGATGLKRQSLNLSELASEVCNFVRADLDPGVVLRFERLALDVCIYGDRGQLHRALLNLVRNAIDATCETASGSGMVVVSVLRVDDGRSRICANAIGGTPPAGPCAVIEVLDNGVGMSPETRAQIFDAFFSTKSHGSGLGLPAAMAIVRAHQGTITLTTASGHGTRFQIFLPLPATQNKVMTPVRG